MVLQFDPDGKSVSDDHFNIARGLTCGADVWLSVPTADDRDTDLLV